MPLTVKSIKGLIYHKLKEAGCCEQTHDWVDIAWVYVYQDLKAFVAGVGTEYKGKPDNMNPLDIPIAYNYLKDKPLSYWLDMSKSANDQGNLNEMCFQDGGF